jgi:4-amino-4-deoxy-L-arabinose transferase-like glycosyltransferase
MINQNAGLFERPANKLLLFAITLVIAYQLFAVGRIPALPTDDDGAYAAAGYQIWQTGRPGVSGYKDMAGMGRDIYVLGHIGAAAQGVLMKLFGVSVVTALLPSVLVGLGVLAMVYLLGRELWGVKTGLIAALLLSLSGVFFSAGFIGNTISVGCLVACCLGGRAVLPEAGFGWFGNGTERRCASEWVFACAVTAGFLDVITKAGLGGAVARGVVLWNRRSGRDCLLAGHALLAAARRLSQAEFVARIGDAWREDSGSRCAGRNWA